MFPLYSSPFHFLSFFPLWFIYEAFNPRLLSQISSCRFEKISWPISMQFLQSYGVNASFARKNVGSPRSRCILKPKTSNFLQIMMLYYVIFVQKADMLYRFFV